MLRTILTIAVLLLGAGAWTPANADATALRAAATSFLADLSGAQREALSFPLKDNARATWSNLPIAMAPPAGVLLAELSDSQRHLVHKMLQASLSSQGYAKSTAIMWLDDILRISEKANLENNPEARKNPVAVAMADNRSSGNYAIAMFGDPGSDGWGWKITGHHLAVNITVKGNQIGALPGYYGSNPRVVPDGPYAGFMALGSESELGMDLMTSLDLQQQARASIASETPQDVLAGPGRRASLKKFEGVPSKSLSPTQLGLLQRLVAEYVRNAKGAAAADHIDAIAAGGWDNLWFSWRGSMDIDGQFYYRVHGARVLIEYNRQDPNHDHSVVRDPVNDYGEDWLGIHYTETHPSPAEYMENLRRAAGAD
jgi:hypothetical protein